MISSVCGWYSLFTNQPTTRFPRRSLWLSTSSDLHCDATRDLRDLGCHLPVINNVAALDRESRALGLSKEYREGVLFMWVRQEAAAVAARSCYFMVCGLGWLGLHAGWTACTPPSAGPRECVAVQGAELKAVPEAPARMTTF